jgi:hypothetical protein
MEGVIFLGLLGAGYVMTSKESHNIDTVMKPEQQGGSETSVYDLNNFKDSKSVEKELLDESHKKVYDNKSNIVDDITGRDKIFDISGTEEGYGENIFSELLGEEISRGIFTSDDRGVQMAPHFSGSAYSRGASSAGAMNLEDNTNLNRVNGGSAAQYYNNKRETEGDRPVPYGNVHGMQDTGPAMEQDRYIASQYRTNDLPFQQEKIVPIHERSSINRDVEMARAQRNSVDNTRTLSNQKVSFGGKINPGKGISHRGREGQVFKNHVDQDYENSEGRWLKTMGAFEAKSNRPDQILPETNRQKANGPLIGPIFSGSNVSGQRRPSFKESDKQQLESDTFRNVRPETRVNDDLSKGSYRSYPNERDVTQETKHEGQLSSIFQGNTLGIQDKIKPTTKETVINTKNMDNPTPVINLPTDRLQDSVRVTRKETVHGDYTGIAGASNSQEMAGDQYLRADTNTNKEIISQGRSPTQVSTMLMGGEDMMNVDIKKIESDYFTNRITNASEINSAIPSWDSCVLTNDKDTLDNIRIADRINNELLDPFRKNEYTHSLESFAY